MLKLKRHRNETVLEINAEKSTLETFTLTLQLCNVSRVTFLSKCARYTAAVVDYTTTDKRQQ